ncbi:MAG: cytochrome c biogenesis protein CcsA [Bacteroidetes bacterium]|nr:cytochrome c biogenesis protein CcsA [Bacteroidota bacterium]MCH7770976.1 cytochrome c biogenesis protein CcsA [Bacteroidota bacterium]
MIGTIFLVIALAFSIMALVMYYLSFRGYKNTLNYARISYHGMVMLIIAASTMLWYTLLTHQYQFKYVFSYSNNSLDTGFLLASFWGGQEGSFMLWLLLTSIIGIILQSYTSKRKDLEPQVMIVFTLTTAFLLVMVSPWFKNPFEYIWATPMFLDLKSINTLYLELPFLQSFFFTDNNSGAGFIQMNAELHGLLAGSGISVNQFIVDGRGLNPQLLNFWMQIHPPILFTGFAMSTVPFAFALSALIKNNYKDWVKQAFPWLLAGMGILGLGVMLGGYWAYEMLGWGGYWAWDPVENSSLIPWIIGVAAIHTMLVQRKTQSKGGIGKFAKTNLILCILTYILVLYSSFLTRSGVLGDASVHSFVDPGNIVYFFLLLFMGTFLIMGFGAIAYRWKSLIDDTRIEEGLLSRELALFTAAVVLIASAVIILVGTSAPIFGQSVDTFFYDEMHIPLAIIIGLLNGLSLLIKWKNTKGEDLLKKSLPFLGVTFVITFLIVIFGGIDRIIIVLLTLSTVFVLVVNSEVAFKIVKGNKKMLGAYVAHIGIALFILGVIGSSVYSQQVDVNLVKNETKTAFGYEMTFTGWTPIDNNTKYSFNIDIKKGNSEYLVKPVMYVSDFNNSLMRIPAILNLLTQDLYISPNGYDEGKKSTSNSGETISLQKGSSTNFDGSTITFEKFNLGEGTMTAMQEGIDFQMGAILVIKKDGEVEKTELLRKQINGNIEFTSYSSKEFDLRIDLVNLSASNIEISISKISEVKADQHSEAQEILYVSASIKPFISFVWIGVAVMVFGFFIALARRLPESMSKSK